MDGVFYYEEYFLKLNEKYLKGEKLTVKEWFYYDRLLRWYFYQCKQKGVLLQ